MKAKLGTETKEHWSEDKEVGSYVGLRMMVWLMTYGGRYIFQALLYPVVLYFFLSNGKARRFSKEYLHRVYAQGESALKTPPTLWTSCLQFFSFGQDIADKLSAWLGYIKTEKIRFDARGELLGLVEKGQGAVLLGSHLGNLEMCRAMVDAAYGVKINVLVHTKHAESFNRLLKRVNPHSDLELIQVSEITPATGMKLSKKIRNGEMVAILGDRTSTTQPGRALSVDFLGEPASFPQGPFILASLLDCPVYTLFAVREAGGHRIFLEKLAERLSLPRRKRTEALEKVVQAYSERLAHYCLRYPLQWNNFFDFWGAPEDSPTMRTHGKSE